MRTKHILSILILTILIFASFKNFAQQFTFSLDPNIKATSGHLGFKAKNFVFFLGAENQKFDVYNIIRDPSMDLTTKYISQEKMFILFFGTKIFFLETKSTKFYIKCSLGPAMFRSKLVKKHNISGVYIEDFSLFQIKFGIGAEYFFSENFSFGGDIGGRTFSGDKEMKIEDYNQTREIDIDLSEYYASLSLNFYF